MILPSILFTYHMIMIGDNLKQLAEENRRLVASHGFTIDYQNKQESQENTICLKKLAPVTYKQHG